MLSALETLRGIRSGDIIYSLIYNDNIDNIDRTPPCEPSGEEIGLLQDRFALLSLRVTQLRCETPPAGRSTSLAWLSRQIKKLAAESLALGGTAEGWPDPSDVFADMDQITALRHDLAELTRADAPYPVPLPPGCQLLPQANFDPFAHGRYYSGKLIGAP